MAIPHVQAGDVARAAEQNALIDEVNAATNTVQQHGNQLDTHTGQLSDHADQLSTHTSELTEHDGRINTLESTGGGGGDGGGLPVGAYFGQWSDTGSGEGIRVDGNGPSYSGIKMTDVTTPIGTPVGCSLTRGTVTVDYAGLWQFLFTVQWAISSATHAMFMCPSDVNNRTNEQRFGMMGAPNMDAMSSSAVMRLDAGDVASLYVANWTGGTSLTTYLAGGCVITAMWLAP